MRMNREALAIVVGFAVAACSSTPKTPREQFERHWKDTKGSDVKVLEVSKAQGGYYQGSGIVDKHPVSEFYNPATGEFADNLPVLGDIVKDTPADSQYQPLMTALAKAISDSIKDTGRFAVMNFADRKNKNTEAGEDLARHLETGLIDNSREVVERSKIDLVKNEHNLQQSDAALFDNTTLARLGQWAGANFIIYGNYSVVGDELQVHARVLSVETAKIVAVKETVIPLVGTGSDTFFTDKVNHK